MTCFAWIFFRAENISTAFQYIGKILDFNLNFQNLKEQISYSVIIMLVYLVLLEWNNRKAECPLSNKFSSIKVVITIFLILLLGEFKIKSEFIYFQF